MPFYGDANDLQILWDVTRNAGAKAFKNKGINYFDWKELMNLSYEDLIHDKITRVAGRPDEKKTDMMIKSGENFLINGIPPRDRA